MADNFISEIIARTPVITRTLGFLLLSITVAVYVEMVTPFMLTHSLFYLRRLQLWRLITPFLYFGPLTFDVILHIVFLCRYSAMLEESHINSSDYLYLLIIVSSLLHIAASFTGLSFLGPSLSATVTYIWTRINPTTHVQLLGCVVFPAFYLPFVVPVFTLISEKKLPVDDVLGILVGHFYYFFKYIYPRYGYDILATPRIIQRIFGEEIPLEEKENKKSESERIETEIDRSSDATENNEMNRTVNK
ncbi:Derlin-2 [Astathelohania contejeani]|uniref:Derlin n=1 Tax=Astathelohania contejeani TaxID=164912 RepID=A0ABQ7I1C3_9MICR|nr:Derlin-2 [Thelohania contejeani]